MNDRKSKYSSRNPPPNNRQLLTLFGIFLAIIIIGIWLINLLIDGLIGIIPPEVEKTIGSVIVPQFEKKAEASPAQTTLNQLLDRLEKQLKTQSESERNYRVLYVPEPTINALAIPGDAIVIYQGLLQQVNSENELMMILGHELGHFAHRDHLRNLGRAFLIKAFLSNLVGDFGSSLAVTVQAVSEAQYSQSQESQADEFGLMLLNNTYGHVTGATDFFARLSQNRHEGWQFLATHPTSRQRVQQLEYLIAKQGYQKGNYSSLPKILQQVDRPKDS